MWILVKTIYIQKNQERVPWLWAPPAGRAEQRAGSTLQYSEYDQGTVQNPKKTTEHFLYIHQIHIQSGQTVQFHPLFAFNPKIQELQNGSSPRLLPKLPTREEKRFGIILKRD